MLDYVTRLLFEDLVLLLLAELVALAVVLAIHRRRLTPESRRLVWITLAVCVLLIVVQKLTVTKREALKTMVWELAVAVDTGDVAAIAERTDDNFEYRNWDKSAFVTQVRQRLQRWQVDQANVSAFDIEIEGDEATVSFRAKCDWRSGNDVQYNVLSSWTLDCVHRESGWKMRGIPEAKVGPGGGYDLSQVWSY